MIPVPDRTHTLRHLSAVSIPLPRGVLDLSITHVIESDGPAEYYVLISDRLGDAPATLAKNAELGKAIGEAVGVLDFAAAELRRAALLFVQSPPLTS